jgi:hypothetical protein
MNQCSGTCLAYNTDFAMVRAKIESDDFQDRIPVSFVQMESRGYPQRDPRQMEMACLTGGQHVFINFGVGDDLLNALATALHQIRYTFRGYWRFAMELPQIEPSKPPQPGYLYALEGHGALEQTAAAEVLSVKGEERFDFGYDTDPNVWVWDRRAAVRKECTAGSGHCPDASEEGACATRSWWCDEQALVCTSGVTWKPDGTSTSCKPVNGKLVVQVRTSTANGTMTEAQIKVLPSLPTVCQSGVCKPPMPPAVPESVWKPAGTDSPCFWYEDLVGWMPKNPGNLSTDWVHYAVLEQSELCTWAMLEPYLEYSTLPTAADYPEAWGPGGGENCFPPPQ